MVQLFVFGVSLVVWVFSCFEQGACRRPSIPEPIPISQRFRIIEKVDFDYYESQNRRQSTSFSKQPQSIGFLMRAKRTNEIARANRSLACLFHVLPLAQVALVVTEKKVQSLRLHLWDITVHLEVGVYPNPATIPKWFAKLPDTILHNMQQWPRVDILALGHDDHDSLFATSENKASSRLLSRLLDTNAHILIYKTSRALDYALASLTEPADPSLPSPREEHTSKYLPSSHSTTTNWTLHILDILPRRWLCQSQSDIAHWGAHCLFLLADKTRQCPLAALPA